MPIKLFLTIADLSLISSIMILLVMVLRVVLHNTPKWTRYIFWGVVAIRLVIPGFISSKASIIPADSILTVTGIKSDNSYTLGELREDLNGVMGYNDSPMSFIGILVVIWIVGLMSLVTWFIFEHIKVHRRLRFAVDYKKICEKEDHSNILIGYKIFLLDGISSPVVKGVIHPVIYLPSGIDKRDMPFIIAHEKVHISRKDYLWKQLGYLIAAIHWFNPFVWIAYSLFLCDIEYACDEKVVLEHEESFKMGYLNALLHYIEKNHKLSFSMVAFGKMPIRKRVKEIINARRFHFSIVSIAVVVGIGVGIVFATRPVKGDEVARNTNNKEIINNINGSLFMFLSDKVKNTNYTQEQIEVLCRELEEQGFSERDIYRIPELHMNEGGLVYGSEHLGADLISVKSDQGVSGYIYRSDMDQATEANSIAEALTNPKGAVLKVYKEDGKEEIGTFTLSDGKKSLKGGNDK